MVKTTTQQRKDNRYKNLSDEERTKTLENFSKEYMNVLEEEKNIKPWSGLPEDFNINKYQGFVYIIKNEVNGMSYIGKKNFWRKHRKVLRRKPTKFETHKLNKLKEKDWPKYLEYKKEIRERNKTKTTTEITKVETEWKNYFGSSLGKMADDIIYYGKDKFTRHILRLCETKFEVSYYEAKQQFDRNVLFEPTLYYNKIIEIKSGRCPEHLKNGK